MIQITFDKEKQLIRSVWTGDVNLEDIYDYIDRLSELRNTFNCLYILQDATQSKILINHTDDLKDIAAYVIKHLSYFNKVCLAHVVVDPQQTVLAVMYKEYLKNSSQFFNETFSTPAAGHKWLKNNYMANCCLVKNLNYGPNQCQRKHPCKTKE